MMYDLGSRKRIVAGTIYIYMYIYIHILSYEVVYFACANVSQGYIHEQCEDASISVDSLETLFRSSHYVYMSAIVTL